MSMMDNLFSLPFHTSTAVAGGSAATAIDLTSDDAKAEVLVPQSYLPSLHNAHPVVVGSRSMRSTTLQSSTSLPALSLPTSGRSVTRRRKAKSSGPELKEIKSHHGLTFWKNKYFQELGIASELQLVSNAAQYFEKGTITTVVPNRYLNLPVTTKNGRRDSVFPGNVEVLGAGRAVRQAYTEHTPARLDVARLVLWTDGSAGCRRNLNRGFAVAWRRTAATGWGRWECAGYKAIGELLDATGMESLAVIKALDKACELLRQSPGQFKSVAIYTDSQAALKCAELTKTSIGRHMLKKARLIRQRGALLSLHWCPGHSKVGTAQQV
jgi:ribonuclease HI